MERTRRKQLAQAYKLAHPPMGIYGVRHVPSGRMLIEQSANVTAALNRHRTELRFGTHRNRALQEDWRADGEAAFAFETLQPVDARTEPDFDYAGELARLLEAWRTRVPPGSDGSYL
jgi:hypothetical protein